MPLRPDMYCQQAQLVSPRGLVPPPGLRPASVPRLPLAQMGPWAPMQSHIRSPQRSISTRGMLGEGAHKNPGGISPRDILTHIDDVVSVMERELTEECGNFKNLLTSLPAKDHQMDEKVAELQSDLKRAETFYEESQRQSKIHNQKMAELEEHIVEMKRDKEKQDSKYQERIEELENEAGCYRAEEGKLKGEIAFKNNRITELEHLLLESHDTKQCHLQQIAELNLKCTSQQQCVDELERDISSLTGANAAQAKEEECYRDKIAHLEHLLREAEICMQKQSHVHASQVDKISELEFAIQEYMALDEKHKSQILALEEMLTEARTAEQSHTARHHSQRNAIVDLESRLANYEAGEELHRRKQNTHNHAINALEAELLEARTNADNQSKLSQSLRVRISGLEQEMHEAQLASEKHIAQSSSYQKRSMELQEELTTALDGTERNRREEAILRRKITDLEKELSEKHSVDAKLHSLEIQVDALKVELQEERQVSSQLRQVSDSIRVASERVAHDAECALHGEKAFHMKEKAELEVELHNALELLQIEQNARTPNGDHHNSNITVALESKVEDLMERNRELEEQLCTERGTHRTESRSIPDTNYRSASPCGGFNLDRFFGGNGSAPLRCAPKLSAALTSPRFALPSVRPAVHELLPYSNHEMVKETKEATEKVANMFRESITLQVRLVASQLAISSTGCHTKQKNCLQNDELESDLQKMDEILEGQVHRLRDLLCKVEMNQEIARCDRQELTKLLRAELQVCDDEQQLSREARMRSLTDLPTELIQSLIALHERDSSIHEIHISKALQVAAEHGRRDIIEFMLVARPDAAALINVKDAIGRTPLDIARVCGWPALERWLQDAVLRFGGDTKVHRRSLLNSRMDEFRNPSARIIAESATCVFQGGVRKKTRASSIPTTESEIIAWPHVKSSGLAASVVTVGDSATTMTGPLIAGDLLDTSSWISSGDQVNITPSFRLPPPYKELLDQIEKTGWRSMNWKNDYTLLHWAAGRGQGALCRYLVQLDANIGLIDSSGRSPAEMAKQAGHEDVARFLDEMSMT